MNVVWNIDTDFIGKKLTSLFNYLSAAHLELITAVVGHLVSRLSVKHQTLLITRSQSASGLKSVKRRATVGYRSAWHHSSAVIAIAVALWRARDPLPFKPTHTDNQPICVRHPLHPNPTLPATHENKCLLEFFESFCHFVARKMLQYPYIKGRQVMW